MVRVGQPYLKWSIGAGGALYVGLYFDQVGGSCWELDGIDSEAAHIPVWNNWVTPGLARGERFQEHMRGHLEQHVARIQVEDQVFIAARFGEVDQRRLARHWDTLVVDLDMSASPMVRHLWVMFDFLVNVTSTGEGWRDGIHLRIGGGSMVMARLSGL